MAWKRPAFGIAAITIGAALIVGSFALEDSGDGDVSPPDAATGTTTDAATTDTTPAPPEPRGDCSVEVTSIVFALEPAVADLFADSGLTFDTLFPANELAEGVSNSPPVASSDGVDCRLMNGVVRTQGGFQISNGSEQVDFRRLRFEFDENEIYAHFKPTGPTDFEAFDLETAEAQFTDRGAIVSAVVPIVLDADAAVAMNATLGTDFLGDLVELGTVTIMGSRLDEQAPVS